MPYEATVPFKGNTAAAFDLASAALTALGFQIASRDGSSLDLIGPGMNNTRESALLGASRIRVTRSAHDLSVEAELGGAERMARFVTIFPVGLCLGLCVVFAVVFSLAFDHHGWVLPVGIAAGGNALLWLILGPMMARGIQARTRRALDALLTNMASAGNAA